jgi:hypothetical protein
MVFADAVKPDEEVKPKLAEGGKNINIKFNYKVVNTANMRLFFIDNKKKVLSDNVGLKVKEVVLKRMLATRDKRLYGKLIYRFILAESATEAIPEARHTRTITKKSKIIKGLKKEVKIKIEEIMAVDSLADNTESWATNPLLKVTDINGMSIKTRMNNKKATSTIATDSTIRIVNGQVYIIDGTEIINFKKTGDKIKITYEKGVATKV